MRLRLRPGAAWRSGWQRRLLTAAWLLLAAWALAIAVAASQLGEWRQELTRTLVQLNADAFFRARFQGNDAVDPEWYRRKALALLSATERLQADAFWTRFLPGSWRAFDSLEEQVQTRLQQEFDEIVVQTLRRELDAHASRLTGVSLSRGSGELNAAAACKPPAARSPGHQLTAAAEDLPEFAAIAEYVAAVERLDQAVQWFHSLQYSGGGPEDMRKLVAYTLGKELPGPLAGSLHMFQARGVPDIQATLMLSQLQWATRCSLARGMTALHTRLLNTNDLFALEQGLAERSAGLFDPVARAVPFDRILERYRAVHTLLDDQHALLAKGRNGWMGQGTLQLGPAYQQLLHRIAATRLLGPDVVHELRNQSGAAFAEFRKQFEAAFGTAQAPGIVWIEAEQRFGLSAQRAALRDGLGALLQAGFMGEASVRPAGAPGRGSSLAAVAQEARELAAERARTHAEILPVFPPEVRPAVARVVDNRVSELIYERAFRTLKAALPQGAQDPIDPAVFRQQRNHVMTLQAVLKETGGAALGARLAAALDGELLRRLGALQQDWERQPLQAAHMDDFSWWHGEPLPLAHALGAADAGLPQPALQRTATRLGQLLQQARTLLSLGTPGLAADPAAARWLQLQSEFERYTVRAPDSSLLRLERYLASLGPDLRLENCADRLAANPPGEQEDEIAQRHRQLHLALVQRCRALHEQSSVPAAFVQ